MSVTHARRHLRRAAAFVCNSFSRSIARTGRLDKPKVNSALESLESRQMLTITATPTFNFYSASNSTSPHSIQVVFSQDVYPTLTASDLVIDNLTTDQQFDGDFTLAYTRSTKTAVFTYAANNDPDTVDVLPDGNYACSIGKDDVSAGSYGTFASDLQFNFFVLSGDIAGGSGADPRDRKIDAADLAALSGNLHLSGKTYLQGNIDYDTSGNVGDDEIEFAQNASGKVLGAPVTGPSSVSLSTLSPGEVTVNWADGVTGEAGWRLQISEDGVTFDSTESVLRHRNVAANHTSFTFTGLDQGDKYWFRVRAYSDTARTPHSPETVYTIKQSFVPMLAAPVIKGWADTSTTAGTLTLKRQPTATRYDVVVYSGSSANHYDDVNQPLLTSSDPSKSWTGLSAGARYGVRTVVEHFLPGTTDVDYSTYSGYAGFSMPAAPTDVYVETISSGGNFKVHWTSHSASAYGYTIQRRLSTTTSWSTAGTASSAAVDWTETGTTSASTWYQYRVVPRYSSTTLASVASGVADAIRGVSIKTFAPATDTVATVAQGADGGDPAAFDYSPDTGVRYADGTLRFKASDLVSEGLGTTWGITRSWTNQPANIGRSDVGTGWMIDQQPFLKQLVVGTSSTRGELLLVLSGTDSISFRESAAGSGVFEANVAGTSAAYFRGDTITFGATPEASATDPDDQEYRLTTTDGRIIRFESFDQAGSGGLIRCIDGLATSARTDSGHPGELSAFQPSAAPHEIYEFEWETAAGGLRRVAAINLKRKAGPTAIPFTARRVEYTYYDASDANGNAGDLKFVDVRDGDSAAPLIDRQYYRYYKAGVAGGYGGGLKLAFDAKSFARMAGYVSDYESMPDSTLAVYASIQLAYDNLHRVSSATVQAKGSTWGDGRATYTYTYPSSTPSGVVLRSTVESTPLGGRTAYYDSSNRVIVSNVTDASSSQTWSTYHRYDAQGRVILTAEPSAVSDYADLVATVHGEDYDPSNLTGLRDSGGLIHRWTYGNVTGLDVASGTGTTAVVGTIPGYLTLYELLDGEQDGVTSGTTPDLQATYLYSIDGIEGTVLGHVAKMTRYDGENGAGALVTNYVNTLATRVSPDAGHNTFIAVDGVATTSPAVTATNSSGVGKNGSGATTTKQSHYDELGRLSFEVDESNVKTLYAYNDLYGTVSAVTRDSDNSATALTTTWGNFDEMGRARRMADPLGHVTWTLYDDVNHATWTFPGWTKVDATHGATTGPVTLDRIDQARGYTEHVEFQPGSIAAVTDPEHGTQVMPSLPTDAETFIGTTMTAMTRSYEERTGLVTESDRYFNLSGVAYDQDELRLGTQNANWYGGYASYDAMARVNRVEDGTGTITRYEIDAAGHVLSRWVGTGDGATTGEWSAGNSAPVEFSGSAGYYANNMAEVEAYVYDESHSGVGDGNVTTTTLYTSASAARVTKDYYDWRDRLTVQRQGVETTQSTSTNRPAFQTFYDNQNRLIATETYDADAITGVTVTSDVPTITGTGTLLARSDWYYDERGQMYRSSVTDVNDANSPKSRLVTNNWYDAQGDVMKVQDAFGLVTKTLRDHLRRVTDTYVTDGMSDLTSSSSYEAAASVDDDHVLEQDHFDYDDDGKVLRRILTQRSHLNTGVGELAAPGQRPADGLNTGGGPTTTPDANRQSTQRFTYDASDRLTRSIELGANDGFASPFATPVTEETPLLPLPDRSMDTITASVDDSHTHKRLVVPYAALTNDASEALNGLTFAGWKVRRNIDGAERLIIAVDDDGEGNFILAYEGTSIATGASMDITLVNPSLETDYHYDGGGRQDIVTDPRGTQTRTDHDALGRKTQTIEAYTSGTPTASTNRTTQYLYDGSDHVTLLRAVLPGVNQKQETAFRYGVGSVETVAASPPAPEYLRVGSLFSNDLLARVDYPDLTTGAASTSASQQESHAYNRLGQQTRYTDRNATQHDYAYDIVGRLATDVATTLGTGVDNSVRAIGYGYDARGNATLVNSYSSATTLDTSTMLNGIARTYDGLSRLSSETQTAGTLTGTVSFAYDAAVDSSGKLTHGGRLTRMTYPNGRVLHYGYSGSTLDDAISRLSFLADDDGSTAYAIDASDTRLETYQYLGYAQTVVRGRPEARFAWSVAMPTDSTKTSGYRDESGASAIARDASYIYTGLDNFGRVAEVRYDSLDGSGDATASFDDFRYGFDKDGNRLFRSNQKQHPFDELYGSDTDGSNSYDLLNRLTHMQRGVLTDTNGDGLLDTADDANLTTGGRSQGWSLDAMGNWSSVTGTTTLPGATSAGTPATQTREHNGQSGIKTVSDGVAAFAYSNDGEMLTDDSGQAYAYDAWGRLVSVDPSGTTPATMYAYDGLLRRISEDADGTGTAKPTIHLYYTPAWQVIEERSENAAGTAETAKGQHVWSPVDVEALVLSDDDAASGGNLGVSGSGLDRRIYVVQDLNYDVTAIVADTSTASGFQAGVVERYAYDAYGAPTVLNADWTLDSSGGGDGASDVGNRYLHQSGRFDAQLGLSSFGRRDLLVRLGRWVSQDPLGFIDGPSRVQYVASNPIAHRDPSGLGIRHRLTNAEWRAMTPEEKDAFARQQNEDAGYDPHGEAVTTPTSVRVAQGTLVVVGLTLITVGLAGGAFGIIGGAAEAGEGVLGTGEAVEEAEAVEGCGTNIKCFVAGTLVLLGDGKTEQHIEDIIVGQRVATDGGVANSADGKTRANDPNATEVDPKTWRLVNLLINARTASGGIDVMQVQELMPLATLRAEHAKTGAYIPVPLDLGDINEVGEGAIVESIEPCPTIESGPGRVVLTTITHLNDYGFHLTLADTSGAIETLGVTGFHKLYTEDLAWASVANLKLGEQIRGEHGDLTVVSLVRDQGVHRVYNLTVESDHVYYVGDLMALSHNIINCDPTDANDVIRNMEDIQEDIQQQYAAMDAEELQQHIDDLAKLQELLDILTGGGG